MANFLTPSIKRVGLNANFEIWKRCYRRDYKVKRSIETYIKEFDPKPNFEGFGSIHHGRVPMVQRKQLEANATSLMSRGFLRNIQPYNPPRNVNEILNRVFENIYGKFEPNQAIGDMKQKFQLLISCSEEFNYKIPNSILHRMKTLGDVTEFYNTPVVSAMPYDALRNRDDLPANLHIQADYVRFHPDTDTKFRGVTAFPRSSTIVTSLRYKKKYKGHTQAPPWDDI